MAAAVVVPTTRAAGLRRVGANALALLLAYLLPRVFTFASVVVAARALGAREFGAYGTAAALAVILSIVATLGMMPLLVRELARAPERAPVLVRAAHGVKTVSNALMLAALFVVARWVLGYPEPVVQAALLLGASYAIGAYAENLAAYFQAVERMEVWTQASAAFGVVSGGAGALLVATTSSVVWFCAAPVLGQAAALGWLLAQAPANVRWGAPPKAAGNAGREWARLVRALAPFGAAFVALTVYYKVDVLLLARWRPPADVGLYAAAYKFVDILQALVLVVAGAVYPRLSRLARGVGGVGGTGGAAGTEGAGAGGSDGGGTAGGEAVGRGGGEAGGAGVVGGVVGRGEGVGRRAGEFGSGGGASGPGCWAGTRVAELLVLGVVPVAGALWLVRGPLIRGLYGEGYGGAVVVLALLAPALPALAVNVLAGFVLGAAGRMALVAVCYGAALVVNVGLNGLLIPRHGSAGAAFAMLVSETLLAVGLLAALRAGASVRLGGRAGVLAVGAAGWCAALAAMPDPTQGVLRAGAYLAGVVALYARGGALSEAERRVLWEAMAPVGHSPRGRRAWRGGSPGGEAQDGVVAGKGGGGGGSRSALGTPAGTAGSGGVVGATGQSRPGAGPWGGGGAGAGSATAGPAGAETGVEAAGARAAGRGVSPNAGAAAEGR